MQEKDVEKKKLYLLLPLGVLIMSVPTFILMVVFPNLNFMFPSVLCHFALLLAIVTFVGVYWKHKLAEKTGQSV
jgi:protein-S-isoprenylcysteine O-methyltransferase Ste14